MHLWHLCINPGLIRARRGFCHLPGLSQTLSNLPSFTTFPSEFGKIRLFKGALDIDLRSNLELKCGTDYNWGVSGRLGRLSEAGRKQFSTRPTMVGLNIQLGDGTPVPVPGFGTGTVWHDRSGNEANRPRNQKLIQSITNALKIGYRHLDAAEIYGTEYEVGIAMKESGVPRSEIFLTTKVFPNMRDPVQALSDSMKRLQVDYVDLFLIHAPFFSKESHGIDLKEAWQAVETLHDKGLAKNIGVSNFRIADLEQLLSFARVKPAANQIEFHPYLQSPDLVTFCHKHGIVVEAYSPLASILRKPGGPVDPVVAEIAKKYQKSAGQVLLRWTTQQGIIAVTTSGKESRQKEQLSIDSFELTEQEVDKIRDAGSALHFRRFWGKQFGEAEKQGARSGRARRDLHERLHTFQTSSKL